MAVEDENSLQLKNKLHIKKTENKYCIKLSR